MTLAKKLGGDLLLKRIYRQRESRKQTKEQGHESTQTMEISSWSEMGRRSKANPWAVSETSYCY